MNLSALSKTALALCLLAAALVQAQTVYRIVGPDGRVTFSDKPPATADQGKVATTGVGAAAAASGAALPFELRQVASRFPVTLYRGRSLLSNRGVPFSEYTVITNEDLAALQRLSGEASLPFLTIGGQRIKGYSETEWMQYLDAAGYPRTSVLPSSYRQSAATPLMSLQKPAPARSEPPPEPRSPTGPGPSNPAGIQF